MNRIIKFIAVIAIVASTLSCQDIELAPQFEASGAQVTIAASVESVSIPASDSLENVITFTWNDPEFSVGLEKSKFTLRTAASGTDFVDFQSMEFSGVLEGTLLGKELNGMALRFGGEIGQPIILDAVVVASHLNNNETIKSNVISITVTPYEDFVLVASTTSVICAAATSSEVGVSFTWGSTFSGFDGVIDYQFQYAVAGTDFVSPTEIDITSFTYSFTQLELNMIALANGVNAGEEGTFEYRIRATNELGTVHYSNVVSVAITTYVAYNSIGLIGDATPGEWSVDTDMHRPDPSKPSEWVATLYLEGGKSVKFRQGDAWDINWGSEDFPSGTATLGDGSNMPVSTSGYYKVEFNAGTGIYNFSQLSPAVHNFVSLIGAQTGWGSDIADLTKDPTNDYVWTGTVTLDAGELKFRADHDWGTNWGTSFGTNATSLSGYTEQGGGNMEIVAAGEYFVYINVATGEYFFGKSDRGVPYLDIGIIGDSTPDGWGSDTNLISNPGNPYKWSGTMILVDGEAKFRADNDWAVNWGEGTFPEGVGTSGGPNIPVSAGTYFITFNTATGEYTFTE